MAARISAASAPSWPWKAASQRAESTTSWLGLKSSVGVGADTACLSEVVPLVEVAVLTGSVLVWQLEALGRAPPSRKGSTRRPASGDSSEEKAVDRRPPPPELGHDEQKERTEV